ncbi:hypothetical protein C7R93_27145 [Brevibacillus fortis]|uniref:Uncharacterized protein n=1 Tax=Brevibacillus fortis TaxID=2126352 RepID=A0A2P7UK93_9BACL|nr:hypothetical protein C7R93_27145 [Brevibacillus fortis]
MWQGFSRPLQQEDNKDFSSRYLYLKEEYYCQAGKFYVSIQYVFTKKLLVFRNEHWQTEYVERSIFQGT